MNFLFALRIICDACFYFAFANVISRFFYGQMMIFSLPFFGFYGYLASFWRDKKFLRQLSALVLVLNFVLFARNRADFILLAIPSFYFIHLVHKGKFQISRHDIIDLFQSFLKAYAVFAFAVFLLGFGSYLEVYSVFYSVMFFIVSIYLMRLLRHDPAVIKEKKFFFINISGLASVYVLGIFLCSDFFITMLKSGFSWIYYNFIMYILLAVAGIITIALYPLWLLLDIKPLDSYSGDLEGGSMALAEEFNYLTDGNYISPKPFVITVFIILTVIALYLIYKKLSKRYSISEYLSSSPSFSYPAQDKKKGRQKFLSAPQKKARELYRKFLLLCEKSGFKIEGFYTTKDIDRYAVDRFGSREETGAFREFYIQARYGEIDGSKEDLKKMKELYGRFKKKQVNK